MKVFNNYKLLNVALPASLLDNFFLVENHH